MKYSPGNSNLPSRATGPIFASESDEFGSRRDDAGLDLREIFLPVWRRKALIALIVTLASLFAFWFAAGIEQRYSTSARVLFEPERLQIIDDENVLVRTDPTNAGLQNQIEILRSAELMGRVAERLELTSRAEFNPILDLPDEQAAMPGNAGPLGKLLDMLPDIVPSEKDDRLPQVTEQPGLSDAHRESAALAGVDTDDSEIAVAVAILWENLGLRPVSESRVIEITYSSRDPVLAAEIANTIAAEYVALQTERKRKEILSASEALAGRVEELGRQLDASEDAVRLARAESFGNASLANRLEATNQALTQTRLDRTKLELSYRRAAEAVDDESRYAIIPVFRDSRVLDDYRARERELQEELASLATVVRGDDPQIRQISARIDEMRLNMKQEARSIVEGLSLQLEIAQESETNLAEELHALEEAARSQSAVEQRLSRLEREAQSSRVVYETFRNRLKEAREQANLQTPDASILTEALVPSSSDSAARFRVALIVGLGGGTMLALGAVFILEALNNSFRSPEEVELATGLPVLAAIPANRRTRSPKKVSEYFINRPNSALAESVRNLRTSVFSSIARTHSIEGGRHESRVVMVTSSVPGEGKTSTCLLLALTTRHLGQSSIVVDCDIRRQRRRDTMGQTAKHGLVSVLEGEADIGSVIQTDLKSGIHVMTSGQSSKLSRSAADYLSSPQFSELIDQLRERYDFVVLDTPPSLVVTDARIVARLSDSIVYMIRWNKTSRNAVAYGLKQLRSVGAKIDGCVLSMVHESSASNMVRNDFFYKRKYRNYISS